MVKVGIIGCTGLVGFELIRLLLKHDYTKITGIASLSNESNMIEDIYPQLNNHLTMKISNYEDVISKSDFIFVAVPGGTSQDIIKLCFDKNKRCIDIGADFRLDREQDFIKYYNCTFKYPDINKECVYGLTEINNNKIKNALIIANPGCYPTAITLGLAPVLKLINEDSIIINALSGLSGAGNALKSDLMYINCSHNVKPYSIGNHVHLAEINQNISKIINKNVKVIFTPHTIPINRGIIVTINVKLTKLVSIDEIKDMYKIYYKECFFIRIIDEVASLNNIIMSNYCDISLHLIDDKNLIIVAAIDNMMKGAAGQAIQNFNIMNDLEENYALNYVSPAF